MLKKSFYVTLIIFIIGASAVIGTSIYTLYSKKKVSVDPRLKEISCIEFDKSMQLWAINDGGDDAKLYRLADDGSISKEVLVTNAKNIDWEDMTQNDF
uniref:hypothetical protein n=1 Tax=Enterococcus faecium TaxID=1352 RepID=UPI0034E9459B